MLDPASASIAIVGFTASLATLIAATVKSAQTVHELWRTVDYTPRQVKGLARQLKLLQTLLYHVRNCNYSNAHVTQELLLEWESSIRDMEEDMEDFQRLLLKLCTLLSRPAPVQKVKAKLRCVLAGNAVARHQQNFKDHCQQLTLMLSMISW